MPALNIIMDGTGAWNDLEEKITGGNLIHYAGEKIQIAALPNGMKSGKPSVAFRFDLPSGTVLIAETSMALFLSAARAFRARYGDVDHE
jgi:hypothetical protein